jgi:uncharacterized protein YajQ (UPF0234 family)
MTQRRAVGGLAVALVLICVACDYSTEVRKSVQRVLKADFGKYHFYATPAGNFGVGTMYLKEVARVDPSTVSDNPLIAIPDTYFAASVTSEQRKDLIAKIFPNAKIGDFSVNETLAKGVSFQAALPNIQGALQSASAGLDFSKGVTVDLQAKQAISRKTLWTELKRAMMANQIADDIKDHLTRRDVIIAMNDVIINGYEATVKIDTKTNAALDAEMSKNVGKVLGDASLKLKIDSGQNGTYHITSGDDAVVVAVLFREIPSGVLEEQDPDTWPVVKVKAQSYPKLQEIYKKRLSELRK